MKTEYKKLDKRTLCTTTKEGDTLMQGTYFEDIDISICNTCCGQIATLPNIGNFTEQAFKARIVDTKKNAK